MARALSSVAVGDEKIADLLGHDRLQNRLENLRLPLRAARVDLDLVAVGAAEELSVQRRVGAAVVVGAGIVLRLGLLALRQLGIHGELGGERIGLLPRLREMSHVAAVGRSERRIDEIGLSDGIAGRPRFDRVRSEFRRHRDQEILRSGHRLAPDENRQPTSPAQTQATAVDAASAVKPAGPFTDGTGNESAATHCQFGFQVRTLRFS